MSESVQSDQNSFFVCCILVLSLLLSACNTDTSIKQVNDTDTGVTNVDDEDDSDVEGSAEDDSPISPSMDETDVAPDTTLRLKIDSADVLETIIITAVATRPGSDPEVVELAGEWSYSETLEAGIYTFSEDLEAATSYLITLDNVATEDGNTTVIYEFTTEEDLAIVRQPQNETVQEGGNVSLTVGAEGASAIAYQWYKDGVSLSGETSAELTIIGATNANSGQYHVVLQTSDDTIQSAIAIVTVFESNEPQAPSINMAPQDTTAAAGSPAFFQVLASGTAPLTYQWYKDGVELVGETQNFITFGESEVADAGVYYVRVSNNAGQVNSATAVLTVLRPAAIVNHPNPTESVFAGERVAFGVDATGDNLSYQWRKDGVVISSATRSVFRINSVDTGDVGDYDVVVSNSVSSVTSNASTLSLLEAVNISDHPDDVIGSLGGNATFSVSASGSGVLTYQWRKDGSNIAGATNVNLFLQNLSNSDAGDYDVVVTNAGGSIVSNSAALTVTEGPASIETDPQSLTAFTQRSFTLEVVAAGTAPIGYQWLKDGAEVSGQTSASLTIDNVEQADAGSYTVRVSNAENVSGTVSGTAVVTVLESINITEQPQAVEVYEGGSAQFNVVATGDDLSYQWRKDGANISGANASTYSIATTELSDAASYDVVISNSGSSETSQAANLVVNELLSISQQPASDSRSVGGSITFTVVASGTGPISYQWRKDGSDISGATSNSLSLSNLTTDDEGDYSVFLSNGGGDLLSTTATLTVSSDPAEIETHPQSDSVYVGEEINLVASASGNEPIVYQWFKDGSELPGETGTSLNISSAALSDAGSYSLRASNIEAADMSDIAEIVVYRNVNITDHPDDEAVYAGTSVTFSVVSQGDNLAYQWRKDGANISGATAESYTIDSVGAGDVASYDVVVSNGGGSETSTAASLSLNQAAAITEHPVSRDVSEGSNALFTVQASGTATLVYQWRKDGVDIDGENGSQLLISSVTSDDAGSYDVVVSNGGGQVVSNSATLTVSAAVANVCTPAAHSGPTYYIATDGSNSNDGSEDAPFATFLYAVRNVEDGALILVKPGTYGAQRIDGVEFTEGVTIRSEVPYQARIRTTSQALYITVPTRGVTIEGFDIAHSGYGEPLVIMLNGSGSSTQVDITNVVFRNNIIHDSYNNDLLKLSNSTQNIRIERNMFYNQGSSDEHIDMNSSGDVEVVGNIFFNDYAASGRVAPGDSSSFVTSKDSNGGEDYFEGNRNTNVRQNIFLNWQGSAGSGFILFGEDGRSYYEVVGATVENNLLIGNGSDAMRSPFGVKGARDITFRNNTIVGDLPGNAFATRVNIEDDNQRPEEIDYYNNIWSDPTGTMNDFSDTEDGDIGAFELDNNVYWNNGDTVPDFTCCDLVNPSNDDNAIFGNPQLPDNSGLQTPVWIPASSQFADGSSTICEVFENLVNTYGVPGASGAAIDRANSSNAPSVDILGNSRGASPDIGAIERQ